MNENKMKEIIIRSSSPYLIAPKGKWIDKNIVEFIDFKEMPQDHKINCLNYLKRNAKPNIKNGSFISGIQKYNKSEEIEIIEYAEKLCDLKINELEIELKLLH